MLNLYTHRAEHALNHRNQCYKTEAKKQHVHFTANVWAKQSTCCCSACSCWSCSSGVIKLNASDMAGWVLPAVNGSCRFERAVDLSSRGWTHLPSSSWAVKVGDEAVKARVQNPGSKLPKSQKDHLARDLSSCSGRWLMVSSFWNSSKEKSHTISPVIPFNSTPTIT